MPSIRLPRHRVRPPRRARPRWERDTPPRPSGPDRPCGIAPNRRGGAGFLPRWWFGCRWGKQRACYPAHRTGALERVKDVRMRPRARRPRNAAGTTPRERGRAEARANGGLPPRFAARRTTGRSVMATVPLVETRADPPDAIKAATVNGGTKALVRGGPEENLSFSGRCSTRPAEPVSVPARPGRGGQNHHAAGGYATRSNASPPLETMLPPRSRIWQTNPCLTRTAAGHAAAAFDRSPAL